jgi:glycoside/pentoside/hexuronide:cation symporter, GPH family
MTSQKLSFVEKAGYSAADAAANFVFMTMILFQLNFYTDVFGLTASAAAAVLLWPRLWDAVFDPIMGIMADRTNTRWGKFRPWILWTAVPWAVVMVLAYTTPKGWNLAGLMCYALVTNIMLMTLYSMNNMPYSALGGVMTADLTERARLNSYRFIAVNIAQFIVGGFTLPLVAKFSQGHDRQHGWQVTMMIWAALCLVLFLITFLTSRERIKPVVETHSTPKQDFRDLLRNGPWKVMAIMTLVHFAILSFRGGALYNYYHQYANKAAMFDLLEKLGLTAPVLAAGAVKPGGMFEVLGYVVHGTRDNLANSNVADVFNSIMNMVGTLTIIIVIMASASFARRYGKKAVAVMGFALSTVNAFAFYLLKPTDVTGMIALTIIGSMVYAPTIPLIWAIFADVADYSEWMTGRRFTGMVFATIGFCLKAGLALGSASFLWIMAWLFHYETKLPGAPEAVAGYRTTTSICVGLMFAVCTALLAAYKLNKRATIEMAGELASRREQASRPFDQITELADRNTEASLSPGSIMP